MLPQHVFHGNPQIESNIQDESNVHEEEGDGGDELYQHEPPGRHPLPDLPVLVAPDGVAAVVHPVILTAGKPELIEASCVVLLFILNFLFLC